MSKDKCKMTRKRFVKLMAGTKGLQVQEEQSNREKHRRGEGGLD